MLERVIWAQDQQVASADLNASQTVVEDAIDRLVQDGIEPGIKFTGFQCIATSSTIVTVGPGALYQAGKVYSNDDDGGTTLNLISLLPSAAKRIVPIVVFGTETDTDVEPRTFLLNAATRTTEARSTATRHIRRANVDKVSGGGESTSPVSPPIDSNWLVVATVLLNPTGIESITVADTNELVSVRDNADAIDDLNVFRKGVGVQIDTLRTDITGLAGSIYGKAPIDIVLDLARDVGQLKQQAGLPDTYTAFGFDPLLALAQSDSDAFEVTGTATNPLFVAKVEEGIRFADVQSQIAQMEMLNPTDVSVSRSDNFILPAFVEVERITSVGKDDEISLSQYENQTITLVEKTASRQVVRYGTPFTTCTNSTFWMSGSYNPITGVFTRDGETFQVLGTYTGTSGDAKHGYVGIRLEQFWTDSVTDTYWAVNPVTVSINGSMIAQTFLNSQESWLTSIGLFFTRIGNASITLALCGVLDSGAPDLSNAIAHTTLAVADIKLYPLETKVPFPATLIERGKRYAIVPVTTGAHYLAMTTGGKFAQGSLFYSTDQSWFAGDLVKDLAFKIYAAQFSTPRLEVQMNPITLAGGITGIEINADMITPSGCSVTYAVKVNNVWVELQSYSVDQLAGLPALLQFKAILTGTTDLMPRLGLASRTQVTTSRPRTDYTHVSTAFTPPTPVKTVTVDLRLEYFDPAHHAALCKLLSGAGYATNSTPATMTQTIAPDDPTAIIRRYTFTFGSAITSFKILISGTTDTAQDVYHVAYRKHVAYAT